MISIFDEQARRLSISWHGIEFNDPAAAQDDGVFTDNIGFSTPTNYQSEVLTSPTIHGGGIEIYNPRIASRVLQLQARVQAPTLSRLNAQVSYIQGLFHPLHWQFWHNLDKLGVVAWPDVTGRPSWVWEEGLAFTRLNDGSNDSNVTTGFPDGKMLLEYHVVPMALPDPPVSAFLTGYGARLDCSWLILDGGRAFARDWTDFSGDGDITPTWSAAPMWPLFTFSATGAGSATLTITVTAGDHSATFVVDASGLANGEDVVIDTRDRSILVDGVIDSDKCAYVSGEWPVLRGAGNTDSVAWTNTTNTTSRTTRYRQSDWA